MAAISPPTGRCTAPSARWSRASRGTACCCGSSTAAAARWGAAADRATTRSSRSRPARRAAACASPSRARSSRASTPIPSIGRRNLETLVAAALEAGLLDSEQLGDARAGVPRGARRAVAARASRVPRPGLRDAGLRRVLSRVHADRRDRRAQHRQPAGVAHGVGAHRGSARDPVGVQLGTVPADAARLVRLRQRGRALARRRVPTACRCCARCTSAGRSSAACCRTWRWCSRRPTSRSRRATRSSCRTRRCARACSAASRAEHARTVAPRAGDHAAADARSRTTRRSTRSIRNRFPYLDPLNHLQVELLRRFRGGQTDERTRRAIHLTINGLAGGLAQQRLVDAAPRHRDGAQRGGYRRGLRPPQPGDARPAARARPPLGGRYARDPRRARAGRPAADGRARRRTCVSPVRGRRRGLRVRRSRRAPTSSCRSTPTSSSSSARARHSSGSSWRCRPRCARCCTGRRTFPTLSQGAIAGRR